MVLNDEVGWCNASTKTPPGLDQCAHTIAGPFRRYPVHIHRAEDKGIVAGPEQRVVASLSIKSMGAGQFIIQSVSEQIHLCRRTEEEIILNGHILNVIRCLKGERFHRTEENRISARIHILGNDLAKDRRWYASSPAPPNS